MSSNVLEVLDAKILAFENLKNVTSVNIENCPNLVFVSFEGFRQLNNVRKMTISKCGNLVSLVPNAVSETWRATTCPTFPHLKHLEIESCGGIAGMWLTDMLLHMQSLEELDIVDCPMIKSLSIHKAETHDLASSSECEAVLPTILAQHEFHLHIPLNVLSTLQKFHIERCPEMQLCDSEGFGGFTSLTKLEIGRITESPHMLLSSVDKRFSLPPSLPELRIRCLPKKLQPYFPGDWTVLKKLEVDDSPDLQSLHLHSCTALESLSIKGYRQLAVLEGLQYLSSLRFLSIEMNPELSGAWVRNCQEVEVRGGHVCLLPLSLEQLVIRNLQEDLVPYLLANLPCLSRLRVYWSPNLKSLDLGSLEALKKLTILLCASLSSLQGHLSELEECEFWSQDLTSLQSSSLTALKHLKLYYCTGLASMLELLAQQAEGFSIFPRLEKLCVNDLSPLATSLCKHLTSLRYLNLLYLEGAARFTDEQEKALQLLTSLQELEFDLCYDLADLPDVLHSLHSLRKLQVYHCPCISKLPEMGLPPSLEKLDIYNSSAQLEDQCRMLATDKLKVYINWRCIN